MQSPTREELWGLFWGKSDDGSTITFKEDSLTITFKEDSLQQNEEEPEAPRDKDTMTKERALEEYENHDMTKQ